MSTSTRLDPWGAPLLVNAWLVRAVVALVLLLAGAGVIIALQARALGAREPLLVGIDAVGRAEALGPATLLRDGLLPDERVRVYRHALSQFVTLHYSRQRATIARDYPASALFLTRDLADGLLRTTEDSVTRFIRDNAAAEIDVAVTQVTFPNLTEPPFTAAVDYTETPRPSRGGPMRAFTAQIAFTVRPTVPNDLIPVNPLGVEILHLRTDEAFLRTDTR